MVGTDIYRILFDFTQPDQKSTEDANLSDYDYRRSPISVLSIDPSTMDASANEPLRAKLLGEGVIKLYRDFDEEEEESQLNSVVSNTSDQTMLSILALPTYFTATDLLGFIGDNFMENITHIRILRSEKANRFLVLLKFNDALRAAEFQYHFDGKPFNSMEPEACHVIYVKSVVSLEPHDFPAKEALIPFLIEDPFTSQPDKNVTPIELPTCPVCLERLDYEITGLLTIPCQHTFHRNCLSKWCDDTCPICRYTNSVLNQNIRRSVRRLLQINSRMQSQQHEAEAEGSSSLSGHSNDVCMGCLATANLWVCLICGNIGCDRYAPEQHSLKHFVETGHCFAMELHTSRIWDYAGDRYVHRLVTTEEDGKIVELPEKGTTDLKDSKPDDNDEYCELLLSQLISQREYYELLLHEKGHNGSTRATSLVSDQKASKLKDLEAKVDDLTAKLEKLTDKVIPALNLKIEMKSNSLRIAANELREVNALNDGLSAKVDHLTKENEELKGKNDDLSEQVKDLMFYLEAQAKFKDQPEEITEGQIIMKPKKSGKKRK